MNEMLLAFNNWDAPVKIPGVDAFAFSIDQHGTIKINFCSDSALEKDCNASDAAELLGRLCGDP